MSYYGTNFTVNGVSAALALRGTGNGHYQVVFQREFAELEQIEKLDWSAPDIQGECILPRGYGFSVEDITYDHGRRAYTVYLAVAEQYLGDVTGYQEKIRTLENDLAEKTQDLARTSSQLEQADEQIMALYELTQQEEGAE